MARGGDGKIKLLLNSIAVIKKANFLYHDKENEVYFQKGKIKLHIRLELDPNVVFQ